MQKYIYVTSVQISLLLHPWFTSEVLTLCVWVLCPLGEVVNLIISLLEPQYIGDSSPLALM